MLIYYLLMLNKWIGVGGQCKVCYLLNSSVIRQNGNIEVELNNPNLMMLHFQI